MGKPWKKCWSLGPEHDLVEKICGSLMLLKK
jgi:hypothetical protein